MAEKVTLARPYAKAAFERRATATTLRAGRRCSLPRRRLSRTSASSSSCRARACSPRTWSSSSPKRAARTSTAATSSNTLAQNRRLGVLPEIAAIYEELRAEVENVADVHVTSAVQLDEAQRTRLAAALKKRLKREVRLHCAVDAGLIGGAIVRAGDFVIDGSLKARLERLAVADHALEGSGTWQSKPPKSAI